MQNEAHLQKGKPFPVHVLTCVLYFFISAKGQPGTNSPKIIITHVVFGFSKVKF
jgi:hypothetical protein